MLRPKCTPPEGVSPRFKVEQCTPSWQPPGQWWQEQHICTPAGDSSSRAVDQGGIALVDIRAQLTALQAKVIGRLLEPERINWKAFFDSWLSMPLTAATAAAHMAARQIIQLQHPPHRRTSTGDIYIDA